MTVMCILAFRNKNLPSTLLSTDHLTLIVIVPVMMSLLQGLKLLPILLIARIDLRCISKKYLPSIENELRRTNKTVMLFHPSENR